jgi:hypothetical protein
MTPTLRGTMFSNLKGMALIARGRPEGLNCFRDTREAFLFSLAPGFGFIIAAVADLLAQGQGAMAIGQILAPLCALLAPSVLSYELARFWGRDAFWYRFIVAFNWCQWLIPPLGLLLLVILTFAQQAGLTGQVGIRLVLVCVSAYALWLNWFLARHGLALTRGRAAMLVAGITLGNALVVFAPSVLADFFG